MVVAVVGAGAWGTTVAAMLAERHETRLWAREAEVVDTITSAGENRLFLAGIALPPTLQASTSLEWVCAGADVVFMAVPAQHVRAVASRLAALVGAGAPVVSLAKGIERGTRLRPTEVLTQALTGHDPALIGIASGPNLACEVAAGQPSATVVALPDATAARSVQQLLMSPRFRVYTSADVVGCEIGGAVKNVIAIAAGMADGLGYGWNTRAALITRGLAELTRLGVALGGHPLTFLGLAGNGDLIATCASTESRNHRVGAELARGRTLQQIVAELHTVAEGVHSTAAVLGLAAEHGVEMPIATQVDRVLRGDGTPAGVVAALMGRAATTELHDLAV